MTAQARRAAQRSLPRVMRPAYAIAAVLAAVLTVGAQAATADGFAARRRARECREPERHRALRPRRDREGRARRQRRRGPALLRPVGRAPRRAGDRALRQHRHPARFGVGVGDPGRRLHRRQGRERLPRGRSVHRRQRHGPRDDSQVRPDRPSAGQLRRRRHGPHVRPRRLQPGPRARPVHDLLRPRRRRGRSSVTTCARRPQLPLFGSAGILRSAARSAQRPGGRHVRHATEELLDGSGTRAMYFANPSDPPSTSGRFAALDADGTSFWMGTLAGLLARYDIASGQRLDRWTAGLGLGGIAVYNPPAPPAQSPGNGTPTRRRARRARPRRRHVGAQTFAMALVGALARHARPRRRPRPAAHVRRLAAPRHGPAGELPRDGPEVHRERHAHRARHRGARRALHRSRASAR